MQFALAQLRKLKMPYSIEEELDLSEELDGFEDILSSEPCQVKMVIKERGIDTYSIEFDIHIRLWLEDAVSLKSIPYTIETTAEEIFTVDSSIEDAFVITGQTLDTKEAIITNILIQKPMAITEENFESDDSEEPTEKINPAFASLKDLL